MQRGRHDADGDAGDGHGLEVAPEEDLDHPAGELAVALERGDPHRRRADETRRFEQRHELDRDDAEHKSVERHDEREENNADNAHAPFECRAVGRCSGAVGRGSRVLPARLAARKTKPVAAAGRRPG